MSGIVGIYRNDGGPVDRSRMDHMLALIAHRGPDRKGQWLQGPIGLGHRLLFTTPESLRECQPVISSSSACVLVWDGRLDNRDELIGLLDPKDLGAKTDPEIVLAAYDQWGGHCPTRLLGDFAFALWDGRSRSLFCARDRFGLKPFHYTWDGNGFSFSSEIHPLLANLNADPTPDDEMVLAFLLQELREADQERALYQGIRRLPPGHFLLLQNGRLQVTRYWAIDPAHETRYARDEDYADHFRTLFQESVRCRLRSQFPIGVLVSGGLDSSSIACMAEVLTGQPDDPIPPIEAFTMFSDDRLSDERPYFDEVISATGFKGHAVHTPSMADITGGLDDVIRRTESPIIGIGYGAGRDLMDFIGTRGCRVLLTGDGGDQLLDGIGALADLLMKMRLWRFFKRTRTLARWYGGRPWEFAKMAATIPLPAVMKYWGKRIVRGVPPPWMNADLAGHVRLRERIRTPRHRMRFASFCQSDTYLSVSSPYYTLKLEVDERDAASQGKELRYPFLDSRLVQFILSIPPSRLTREGIWKAILRDAMNGVLPEPIRLRQGKGDWTTPDDEALTRLCRHDPPAPVKNISGRMERYVNLPTARAMVNRFLQGERSLRFDLWFLVTLDHWLSQLKNDGRTTNRMGRD